MLAPATPDAFARPYVISWNLTSRCTLACEHCYLDAGGKPAVDTPAIADRSELDTEASFRVVDEIAAFAPDGLLILTGGEPLLRRDIVDLIRYAGARDLWVVVGTNGVKITANLAAILKREGVRGLSLCMKPLCQSPAMPTSGMFTCVFW
jgi:MoaA/NifB/PqqE/SkfB family radical SAM enzyme